jgi:hypothetical protein
LLERPASLSGEGKLMQHVAKPPKPLSGKAYGSIPHLPNSRIGPGDHHCHEGQWRICCEKVRDKHDRIIVTEKLDGACVSVANVDGNLVAMSRAGYKAEDALYDHLKMFGTWASENEAQFKFLKAGQRIIGEWLAMAHGTVYRLACPFVAFDIIEGKQRIPHDEARHLFKANGIEAAAVVHDGAPIAVDDALAILGEYGRHGAAEPIEGAVWRVERKGEFDFIAKYVRPDKQDGKYLPNVSNEPAIWCWPFLAGEAT